MKHATAGITLWALAAAGQPVAAQARAGKDRIPDGQYSCQMWIGSSYVTLAAKLVGGKATSNPLTKTGATITGVTPSAGGITITYTTARGYRESMDCKRA
ncbi:hypothetical protein M9979_05070 [Sphingomonas sp. RP10(2022)]|uniref:Uncharacterized protein n=1 Tax=Sphingomonas liriopis TaxID=2949094 RepID=A0A9X2KPT2_9SPHN|nr:hypothetical protein [Sphingomonas liriopis]MCP3734247.1 hypothetical protein [Sphingomonas liriopis]